MTPLSSLDVRALDRAVNRALSNGMGPAETVAQVLSAVRRRMRADGADLAWMETVLGRVQDDVDAAIRIERESMTDTDGAQ